jgi:hypothetical protein
MTSRDFVYWLQGFIELRKPGGGMSEAQVKLIEKHLALVFKHEIDPSMGDEKKQETLNEIHNAGVRPHGDIVYRC